MTSDTDGLTSEVRGVARVIERGVAAWEQDNYGLALACFQMVLDEHPDFPDVRNKAGLCLAMLGDLSGALEHLDAAIALNPRYAEAHLNRAVVLNELGRFEEARSDVERAGVLERAGEYPADLGNRLAIAHARVADLYLECFRPGRAVDEYLLALEIRPEFLDIRSKLAEAYMAMDRLEDARRELQAVLELNPAFTAARRRLGVLLLREGDREGAVREWTRCALENPADGRVQAYLAGSALGRAGEVGPSTA